MEQCRYVAGKGVMTCGAAHGEYAPSPGNIEKYCMSSRFKLCPLYCRAVYGVPRKLSRVGAPSVR